MKYTRTTTVDELWDEFKKCIVAGNWNKFKTKNEFREYLKERIKKAPGIECHLFFMEQRKTFKVILPITPGLLQELGIQ